MRPKPVAHEALRNDFERRILDFIDIGGMTNLAARTLANEMVHLCVLHGLLPETEE